MFFYFCSELSSNTVIFQLYKKLPKASWVVILVFLHLPTWAQVGRQDFRAISRLKHKDQLFVVAGEDTKRNKKPDSFYSIFRAVFESTWTFTKYEIITPEQAKSLGQDTNLFFLRLSPDMYTGEGAYAMITKGFKTTTGFVSQMPHIEANAVVKYSAEKVWGYEKNECEKAYCMRPSFQFVIKAVQSYLKTAYEIENGSFKAVAWHNREKLKYSVWYVSEINIYRKLKVDDKFKKMCPLEFRDTELCSNDFLRFSKLRGAEDIALLHFDSVYGKADYLDKSLVSLSGDLLFYHPYPPGSGYSYPHVDEDFMVVLNAWLELKTFPEDE